MTQYSYYAGVVVFLVVLFLLAGYIRRRNQQRLQQQQQNELDLIETGGVYNNGLTGRPQYTFYMDENTQRPQMVAIHQLPPQHQQRRQSIDEENLPRYTPPEPSSSQNKDDTPPSYAEVTAPPRAQVPPSS